MLHIVVQLAPHRTANRRFASAFVGIQQELGFRVQVDELGKECLDGGDGALGVRFDAVIALAEAVIDAALGRLSQQALVKFDEMARMLTDGGARKLGQGARVFLRGELL